ncbi:PAS domain-containing protein [Ideonella dechloratans]|uniref:histidine kinase n=1 Tax=Ideonella dechloratans TaxID=36863 RepID=A0A643F7R7_IDEDE|nr:ATP-binding protein [Ideonella dechloratans]KAB0576386.1 PAS domain-containing protein [Ideonella dechloratans]UFU10903.1 ATP-binding protein [Ideonella dechloratans]
MSDRLPSPHPDLRTLPLEGVDESTWVDVIHKMDEVYAQLLADEAAREEKNAELERTQQFILSLLTAMSDVLLACDQQGLIEETNAALCALVGRPDAVLRGTPAAALMMGGAQGEDARRMREALAQSQTRRDGAVVEVALADAMGQPVPVDFNCTPRLDHQGRVIGHVCVGRPLGELKRAYRALQEAHEALKRTQAQLLHSEKMASLGRLVAGVAHELNNPISFLLGNVSALRKYADRLEQYLGAVHAGPLPPELAALRQRLRIDAALADLPSVIDGMTEGAHRTADIVNALKRFSVIDRMERGPVDLGQVVEQAIHWVRKGAAPDFRIDWTPPAAPVQVLGSAGQLLQVMLNLIQNAADACAGRPEGRLRITLEPPERPGGKLRLRFADNGPGIAPEHVARVFDPFFTTKPVGKGTGLGLSISYGLIDQHGGHLSLAPAAGGGAEFTVELPVAEAA